MLPVASACDADGRTRMLCSCDALLGDSKPLKPEAALTPAAAEGRVLASAACAVEEEETDG